MRSSRARAVSVRKIVVITRRIVQRRIDVWFHNPGYSLVAVSKQINEKQQLLLVEYAY